MHKTIDLGPGQCILLSLSRQPGIKINKSRWEILFIDDKKFKDKTIRKEPKIINCVQTLAADPRPDPIVKI